MWRRWIALTAAIGFSVVLCSGFAMAQNPPRQDHRVHVLTPEKNGGEIQVRPGDEVVLRLPGQAPFEWGAIGNMSDLRKLPSKIEFQPIEEPAQPPRQVPNPPAKGIETVNDFGIRYQVLAASKNPTHTWVYCPFGRTTEAGVPIKPTEPLKPHQTPRKTGTFFSVKLLPSK